jgi:SOS-response transcriptional repressor LexA
LPVLAIKLALILTVMDWADDGGKESLRITEAHWARAQMLSEEYRASAHRLLAELNVSQDVKNEQKVLDFIARTQATKPPTKREIHRGAGIKNRKDAHSAVEALIESGVIVEVERRSNGAGRPTMAYKLMEG